MLPLSGLWRFPLLFSLPLIANALPGARSTDSLKHFTGLQQNDQVPFGPFTNSQNANTNIDPSNVDNSAANAPPIVQFQLAHSFTPANSKYIQVLNGTYDYEPIKFNPAADGYVRANFTLDTTTGIVSHWLNDTEFQLMVRAFSTSFVPWSLNVFSVNTSCSSPRCRLYEPLPCTIDRWSTNLECSVMQGGATLDHLMTMDSGREGEQIVVLVRRGLNPGEGFHNGTIKALPPPRREPQPGDPPQEPGRPARRVVTLDEWLDGEFDT